MRTITRLTVAGGIAATIALSMAGTALADPPAGTTPTVKSVVGVGSDTSQSVVDDVLAAYDGKSPAPAHPAYSFDAVPQPDTITPKAGCTAISRPNGSGGGIAALNANARPSGDTTDYCLDFARSSRGPQTGDGAGQTLAFVPFAEDGVTWSSPKGSNAVATLTTAQLNAIYSCNDSALGGPGGPVTWNEVGGKSTAAVVPVVPQSSSGTRSFFLSKIGVTTLGSCVLGQDNSVEENEGTNAIFSGTNAKNIVFPYSIAVYLAQSQNGHGTGNQGSLTIKQVNGVFPTTGSPKALNPAFPYTRFIYNVVRDSGTSTHVPTYLQALFGKNNNSGYFCTNTSAKSIIASYGFRGIGSSCGTVTLATS